MTDRLASAARPRTVERLVAGIPTQDGAGVKLNRVLTRPLQRRLDPFLMLDAFGSDDPDDYIAGFPDHPHRGFETITYMLAGSIRHRDSVGHEGVVHDGGVQWMTAGRGVIHSEKPEQNAGRMEGFQLWLNLPSADKMREPWYRDIEATELPRLTLPGADVAVIAGSSHGVAGAVQRDITEPLYLDVHLDAGASFEQALPAAYNAFVYVYRGGAARRRHRRAGPAHGDPRQRRRRHHAASRRHADARVADRRPASRRADRAVRPVRHEHPGAAAAGRRRLPRRPAGLAQRQATTCTPFQNAMRPLICAAASLGSG